MQGKPSVLFLMGTTDMGLVIRSLVLLVLLSPAGGTSAIAASPPVAGFLDIPFEWSLDFYRWGISPVDGQRCPMRPTCSRFASGVIDERGPINGILLTVDRLNRCGHDLSYYAAGLGDDGRFGILDPVRSYSAASPGFSSDSEHMQSLDEGVISSTGSSYARFLERAGQPALALSENLQLFRDVGKAAQDSAGRDAAAVEVARLLYEHEAALGSPLKWVEVSRELPVSPSALSAVTAYGAASLLRAQRWRESLALLSSGHIVASPPADLPTIGIMKGLAHVRLQEWDMAHDAFANAQDPKRPCRECPSLADLALEGKEIPHKNPRTAAALGVVPGLGYLYTGHKQTALSAVLVNGLMFFGTREAIENEQTALAIGSGLFAVGWYFGSIVGSKQSAERYNRFHLESHWAKYIAVDFQ